MSKIIMNEYTHEVLIFYALSQLNKPYKWGGSNPIEGYDCSGLIQELLASVGHDPVGDQTALALYDILKRGYAEVASPLKTDILFFGKSKKEITHVAMALNEWQMIEAGGGGSAIKTLEDAKNASAFVRIRPISSRTDLVSIIRLG